MQPTGRSGEFYDYMQPTRRSLRSGKVRGRLSQENRKLGQHNMRTMQSRGHIRYHQGNNWPPQVDKLSRGAWVNSLIQSTTVTPLL